MDPNANLAEQARIIDALDTPRARGWAVSNTSAHDELRELRAALRDWLQGGGFEPDWTQYPHAAKYYGH